MQLECEPVSDWRIGQSPGLIAAGNSGQKRHDIAGIYGNVGNVESVSYRN
jgi:hypothetical protein